MQKAAEEARFDRARKMTEVEGRKKYEFLEAMCSSMDAHVRFFERGHEVRLGVRARIGAGVMKDGWGKNKKNKKQNSTLGWVQFLQAVFSSTDAQGWFC